MTNEPKYYLLTFCEDYGDEHNVPALACMTQEQYDKGLKTPSGELREEYDEEIIMYNRKKIRSEYVREEGQKRGLYHKKPIDFTHEEKTGASNPINKIEGLGNSPIRVHSNISAGLGNSGDGFNEDYNHLYLMEEFVPEYVKVTEVDKNFYDTFHKAGLARLSLCNVFEIE